MERRIFWINPISTVDHLQNKAQRRIQLCKVLDSYGFNFQVWAVAASGFFTDSYNLFATNVILPTLAYVYWPNEENLNRETVINIATLSGSIVGQVLFGYLADRFGRQKLYGVELIVVIIATLGLAQSSYGFPNVDGSGGSMSILGWILTWRCVMGIGIGAEYPLSAIITAEWASVRSRPRMLASVFIMQALGQLAAYLVGLAVFASLNRQYNIENVTDHAIVAPIADKFWRWVTGLGAIPAIIALIFRLTIPESGRWTLDVQGEADRAVLETRAHFGSSSSMSLDEGIELQEEPSAHNPLETESAKSRPFSRDDLHQYFFAEGNWRYLTGASACWFVVDFAYFGLQINNPRFLTKLWASRDPEQSPSSIPAWLSDPASWNSTTGAANTSIYKVNQLNSVHAMIAVSIGEVLGGLILIKVIPYLPRKKFLTWSFIGLAVLTAATGISFLKTFRTPSFGVTLMLFVLCQLSFNLGPNSLTFIIPAEIFPTRYRCTCHGVSAAAGKLGSVIVQALLPHMKFGLLRVGDLNSNGMGWVFIIFSIVLLSGAVFSWAWIPEVQSGHRVGHRRAFPNKSLEELAEGRERAEAEGQVVGLRRRLKPSGRWGGGLRK